MTRIVKFVALVASIAVFVMPAATMPLHCVLMAPSGGDAHPCHMMGMTSSANQITTAPSDHSCCQVSAARPEPITVPRAPAGSGIVVPLTLLAFLSDLPAVPALREAFDWNVQSPGGPPQAVLCTFLI
jgi:hypothetical protein